MGDQCNELAKARSELRDLLDAPRPRGLQHHGNLGRLLSDKHRRASLELLSDMPDADDVSA